jgi:hypothetical protein
MATVPHSEKTGKGMREKGDGYIFEQQACALFWMHRQQ